MRTKNRRKHFLVYKSLQLHYLFYIVAILVTVSAVGMTGIYFGVWGSVVKAFSEESLRETIMQTGQIYDYDQARHPSSADASAPRLQIFQEMDLLSARQKEVLQQIMDETHQKILGLGVLLLIFIAWGSIFLTHKIAGPLFKLNQYFKRIEKGDLTARIQFRNFDEIKETADRFNEMAASLDAKIGTFKRLAKESRAEKLMTELSEFKTTSN